MFANENRWEHLLHISEELDRVCDQVDGQLSENRRKRKEWYAWTGYWKRYWLEHDSTAHPRSALSQKPPQR